MNIISFLRCFACLIVFLLHFGYIYTSSLNISVKDMPIYIFTPAWTGVWIFFILSGYLMGKGFFQNRYKTDTLKDFLKFYFNRCIRIIPVYFFIVLIDIYFVNTHQYFDGSQTLFRTLSFTLRNPFATTMTGALWFISTIVQLYLLTPFVWKFIINPIQRFKRNNIIYSILLIFVSILFFYLRSLWHNNGVSWDYFILCNVAANIDLFFCSFIFARFVDSSTNSKIKKFLRPMSLILFIGFMVFNTYWMWSAWSFGEYLHLIKLYIPTIILYIIFLLLYSFDVKAIYNLNIKNALYRIINNIISFIGLISFGIYCFHSPIILSVVKITSQYNLSLKESLFVTLTISFISSIIWGLIIYHFIEKPMSKYKL